MIEILCNNKIITKRCIAGFKKLVAMPNSDQLVK